MYRWKIPCFLLSVAFPSLRIFQMSAADQSQAGSGSSLLRIAGAVQTFAWGRPGSKSVVAQLAQAATPETPVIDEAKTYAELWFGTHTNGPSRVLPNAGSAGSASPVLLKDKLHGVELPFIFKVLSINGALSLQAHPDQIRAKRLHRDFPQHYKDGNHKPELVVALSPMEVLCGFRPLADVAHFARTVPEFGQLVKNAMVGVEAHLDVISAACDAAVAAGSSEPLVLTPTQRESEKAALRGVFAEAMRADKAQVDGLIQSFVARATASPGSGIPSVPMDPPAGSSSPASSAGSLELAPLLRVTSLKRVASICSSSQLELLLLGLAKQYPGDVGFFGPLFLNHFTLSHGESVFLEPNVPHAYLLGECVEVMACSDNVVRAGLTPKHRDIETLVEMLTYDTTCPDINRGKLAACHPAGAVATSSTSSSSAAAAPSTSSAAFAVETRLYAPPAEFPEFMVSRTYVSKAGAASSDSEAADGSCTCSSGVAAPVSLPAVAGPSVLLVIKGKAEVSIDGSSDKLATSFGSALCIPSNASAQLHITEVSGIRYAS